MRLSHARMFIQACEIPIPSRRVLLGKRKGHLFTYGVNTRLPMSSISVLHEPYYRSHMF